MKALAVAFLFVACGPVAPVNPNPQPTPQQTVPVDNSPTQPATTKPDVVPGAKRVFVTSATYNGKLGGLAGADDKCQAAADAAGLDGTFVAWLSAYQKNAIDRIKDVGPWYSTDRRTKIFSNKANLKTAPIVSVPQTENGTALTGGDVWTGTNAGGEAATYDCETWAYDSAYGQSGWLSTAQEWTEQDQTKPCSQKLHLYCFEQGVH